MVEGIDTIEQMDRSIMKDFGKESKKLSLHFLQRSSHYCTLMYQYYKYFKIILVSQPSQ
jgi:hypothetical protein